MNLHYQIKYRWNTDGNMKDAMHGDHVAEVLADSRDEAERKLANVHPSIIIVK
jgi:hypothetical protein